MGDFESFNKRVDWKMITVNVNGRIINNWKVIIKGDYNEIFTR